MVLSLNTVRCPAGISPQKREAVRGALSIGRGVECDWVLPDPERVLSKRHCTLAWQDGGWVVTDISRNGTFLNGHALDPGVPHALGSGDRLTLGTWEIEAHLEEAAADVTLGRISRRAGAAERLTSDPFAPFDGERTAAVDAPVDSPDSDPLDSDPLHSDWESGDRTLAEPRVTPDRGSDLHGQFRPPRPTFELLPPDWDQQDEEQRRTRDVPRPSEPLTPAPGPSVSLPADTAADDDGFAAFAAGAGVSGQPRSDSPRALHDLGAAFRAAVSGLRRALIARAAIKGEFRIDQTVIRASGNNPLKFAADDDDALAALLGTGRRGGMTAERAMAEAMRDMRDHELAMAAAVPEAIRAMLGELSPARLTRDLPASAGDAIPGRRKARAWDAFEVRHARLLKALDDDFDGLVGRAFMHAYEAALTKLGDGSGAAGSGPDPSPSRGD